MSAMLMNLPFSLPDWLPGWAFLLLALPALLYLLAFLLMPFSVFGVKARLEAVEAQLDAMTEELRNLAPQRGWLVGPTNCEDGVAVMLERAISFMSCIESSGRV